MIKGAMFTIGIIVMLGGFGFAAITVLGAAMSDSPSASNDAMGTAGGLGCVGLVGIALIIGAFFVP